MAKGPDPLRIEAPRSGIARSPHVGFGDVRNMDVETIPGIAKLNNIMSKESGATVDAQIWWIVQNPAAPANYYAVDDNGSVYNSSDSGDTWAELSDRGGSGQGAVVWKDYLFIAEDTTIDVYGPLSGAASWDNDWQTIDSDTDWHPMIVSSNDGNIYGGAGRYVFSIAEVSGQNFDPDTGGTYTFTQQALDLPEDYRVKCLAELGNNLMIGTWQGTAVDDVRIADIFPWDRNATSFGQPIRMAEYGVHAMLNTGNSLAVLAGIDGTIFRTSDGANIYPIGQLPQDLSGGKYIEFYPGALMSYKDRIFFGVGQNATTAIPGMGVYSLLETSRGNILTLEHLVSTLSDGSSNALKPSALIPTQRDRFLLGWRDNATYGIDLASATSYAYGTDYSGFFESPLYVVGTQRNKRQFREIEFTLAKELAASEGIRVKYRINLTDSYTTLDTFTTTNIGTGVTSFIRTANIPACEMVQIRVELLGTSTTTPEFKSLVLR